MECFDKVFCEHPRNVNMNYFQHGCFSCVLSYNFFCASLQACFHSVFPILFETSSSDYSYQIYTLTHHIHDK